MSAQCQFETSLVSGILTWALGLDFKGLAMSIKFRKPRNFSRAGKCKVTVWLEKSIVENLRAEASTKFVSQQSIIETELRDRYQSTTADDLSGVTERRLNAVDDHLHSLERQLQILVEGFAMFIRMWFLTDRQLSDDEKRCVMPRAIDRYKKCLEYINDRVKNGKSVVAELEEIDK